MSLERHRDRPTRSQTTHRRKDAEEFELQNSRVVVEKSSFGFIARIERLKSVDYGILAPATVDALEEVAVDG